MQPRAALALLVLSGSQYRGGPDVAACRERLATCQTAVFDWRADDVWTLDGEIAERWAEAARDQLRRHADVLTFEIDSDEPELVSDGDSFATVQVSATIRADDAATVIAELNEATLAASLTLEAAEVGFTRYGWRVEPLGEERTAGSRAQAAVSAAGPRPKRQLRGPNPKAVSASTHRRDATVTEVQNPRR